LNPDDAPKVSVYYDHHWLTTVHFRYKWQAWLFHTLLNGSTSEHAGAVR
jgi:hypothetical protein